MVAHVIMGTSKVLEFLKKHNIKWMPCNLETDNRGLKKKVSFTKDYMPNPKDFTTSMIDECELKRRQSFVDEFDDIVIDTSNVYHFDFDMKIPNSYSNDNWDLLSSVKSTFPYYESITKKLPHAFFISDTQLPNRTQTVLKDVEILANSFSFCKKDAIIYNTNDTQIPTHNIDKLIKQKTERTKRPIIHEDEKKYADTVFYNNNIEDVKAFLDIIDVKHIDNYDSWYKLGSAIFNCGYHKSIFDDFSRRSQNYGGVDKLWHQFETAALKQIGFGTICYYAKISNPSCFSILKQRIITSQQKTELEQFLQEGILTHHCVSKIFFEKYKGLYQFSKNYFYRINKGGILEKLTHDAETILAKEIKEYILQFLLNACLHETDDDKRKKLLKASLSVKTNGFKKSCVEEMKQEFLNDTLINQIDNNNKLIGFNNGIYDLEQDRFRIGTIDDLVSMTTGNDFVQEVNEDNMMFFEELFDSYFKSTETSHYFKKHLGSLLEGGNKEQKCYFWCGNGRNGKGTTDQLLKSVLGQYYTELSNEFFTLSKHDSDKPEPEVLKLRHKRISMTHEPEGSQKYLTSKFKRLSGGDALVARGLYEANHTSFTPTNKPIIQTNHLPEFTDVDDGLQQRLVVIEFPYKFLDPNSFDETNQSHKPIDLDLGDKIKTKKNDFIHFLIKYYKIYKKEGLIDIPPDIKTSINSYRKDIDSVKTFCEEALEPTKHDMDRITTNELLMYHNKWCENRLTPQKFHKRICAVGYTTDRCMIDGRKSVCIRGYKWNKEFVYDLNKMEYNY